MLTELRNLPKVYRLALLGLVISPIVGCAVLALIVDNIFGLLPVAFSRDFTARLPLIGECFLAFGLLCVVPVLHYTQSHNPQQTPVTQQRLPRILTMFYFALLVLPPLAILLVLTAPNATAPSSFVAAALAFIAMIGAVTSELYVVVRHKRAAALRDPSSDDL